MYQESRNDDVIATFNAERIVLEEKLREAEKECNRYKSELENMKEDLSLKVL